MSAAGEGRIWFVTGTGTGVGKTTAGAALLRAARDAGLAAGAVKPVGTGHGGGPPDMLLYTEAAPGARCRPLHAFPEACSPHLAAERNGSRLAVRRLAAAIREEAAGRDPVLVEGAGGLMVPINRGETMLDLAVALRPVVFLWGR